MSGPSWVRYGERHGWMLTGSVPASKLAGADFWAQAVRVACIAEGGHVDMVQCYDAGIMSAGPLGFTAAFGTLAALLAAMPPAKLVERLGGLFAGQCMGLRTDPALGPPAFVRGLVPMTADELRGVFLGGSDGVTWDEDQKEVARLWTVALGDLLADPATFRSTSSAATKTLRSYLGAEAAQLLAFSGSNPPTLTALRRAAACFLSYAVNNPRGALRLLKAAGPDADRMLEIAAHGGAWPETFAQRTGRTRAALAAETW